MSKIISMSARNSSLEFQLFEMPNKEVLTSGTVERIGFEDTIFTIKVNGEEIKKVLPIPDYIKAVSMLLEALVEYKIVNSLGKIIGAGHRAVYGREIFRESVPVTEGVVEEFVSLNDLVPLRSPAGLVGYNTFKDSLFNCKHVFMFDTAFHSAMPKEPCIYVLPMKYYDEYETHRYGFYGAGHKYVSLRCAELMNKKVEGTKTIACYLGNGVSITAIDGGKSINTPTGLTSLTDVMMGTYYGDIDPATVAYVMKKAGATPDKMDDIMNMRSGMFGTSGISSDTRDTEDGCKEENLVALLTTEVYVGRAINVVGDYYVQLGGADMIVFTGGIGENNTNTRKMICGRLPVTFGIQLNEELNRRTRGKEVLPSTVESKVAVWLTPANEELMIARDAYRLIA